MLDVSADSRVSRRYIIALARQVRKCLTATTLFASPP
jgi:spore coat protein CotF